MPRLCRVVKRGDPTQEEQEALFKLRLDCLAEGTAVVNGGSPLPVCERWGWRCYITTLGRDRDGSLLASITAEDPAGKIRLFRNVRLVKPASLNL